MSKIKRFSVVDGGRPAELKDTTQIVTCRKCGGSSFVEVRQSLTTKRGRISGGVTRFACVDCLAEGSVELL